MNKESSNNVHNAINYILVYLLIGVSGSIFFLFWKNSENLIIVLMFISFIYYISTSKIHNIDIINLLLYFFVFTMVILFTIGTFHLFPRITVQSFTKKVIISFFVIVLVNKKFFKIYINVLFFLSVSSLIIFALSLLFPSVFAFFIKLSNYFPIQRTDIYLHYPKNILIHNFWQIDWYRNSGAFWEPGANAGFTLLALAFNLFIVEKKLLTVKNIIFLLAVLSTLSTSGYLNLFLLIFFYLLHDRKERVLHYIYLILILVILAYSFTNIDFFGEKIIKQYEEIASGDPRISRFASAEIDLKTFIKYPLSGYPMVDINKGNFQELDFRTNGLFILLSKFGIIFFIFYFYQIYQGFKFVLLMNNVKRNNIWKISLFFVVFLALLSFSENYFERPLFIMLSFLPIIWNRSTAYKFINNQFNDKDLDES